MYFEAQLDRKVEDPIDMSGNNLLVDFLYGVVMLSLLTFGVDLTLFEVLLV